MKTIIPPASKSFGMVGAFVFGVKQQLLLLFWIETLRVELSTLSTIWSVKILQYFKTLQSHRGPEQKEGLMNYTKRSDTVRVAGATPLTTPHGQITEFGFFEKIIFLFLGAPKNFFDPQRPYLALETSLLGGHTSKTFLSELQFWSYRWQNSTFLA